MVNVNMPLVGVHVAYHVWDLLTNHQVTDVYIKFTEEQLSKNEALKGYEAGKQRVRQQVGLHAG